jgi:hypothetical protein
MIDAGKIFDMNEAEYSQAIGTPKSEEAFIQQYIPSTREGRDMEAAFLMGVADHERKAFIVGFKAGHSLAKSVQP